MNILCANKITFQDHIERVIGHANEDVSRFINKIIDRTSGAPLKTMGILAAKFEAKASEAWIKYRDAKMFRQYCYAAAKLDILSVSRTPFGGEEFPYQVFSASSSNPYTHLFYNLMSDAPAPMDFITRNADEVFPWEEKYNASRIGHYMMTDIKLALLGNNWPLLHERAEAVLANMPKTAEKWRACFEFMSGLATQDKLRMQEALRSLLEPKAARKAAYELLASIDFFLQPQVLFYGKIAARHGYDLGIDHEIAPKVLIDFTPLDEYVDPYDFMKDYDLYAPYEFQYEWIERYTHV